ncbi:MAG TPA: alpha-ketoacid dehydrogenase subunit beta [Actinomycetes bacterium]|nr:alpha-ketoacid dehydrogenase subunit beta [Actinomycetes bacterium]
MTRLSYARAIALALGEAMDADGRVFVLGEDVAHGGAYGATQGLLGRFGPERVRDTPISEAAIVGYSLGAALAGMRPVAEIMHMDFIACAMDQVVNQAAKVRYMSGGRAGAPLVIRTGAGGWLSAAAQHSQSLEAWFTHVPGIKVVTAGTPADARAVLRAAIADENPVLVIESLSLYERQDEVPEEPGEYRLGTAEIKRAGSDATVVTWGAMVPRALEAAGELAAEGVQVEVVDLKSLRPWDQATVLASVERTNRAVVAHQAHRHGGFGAEVAATIAERAFDHLDAPVARVGSLDVPVPFSPPLEEYVLPSAGRIAEAVRGLA